MDIEGIINPINFGDILYSIYSQKETGILYVKDQSIIKTIYIRNGSIVFALSNENEDRFGEVLLKEGMITIDQYYQSSRQIAKDKRQGTILVQMGAIKDDDLINAVRFQVKQIIYSIFKWRTGKYVFQIKDDLDDKDLIDLQLFIPNIILDGMKRLQSWFRIEKVLFHFPIKIRRAFNFSKLIKSIDLNKKEYKILKLIEKPMTLDEIFNNIDDIPDFEVCDIIWRLITIRFLEKVNISKKADNFKDTYPYAYDLIEKYNNFFILTYDVIGREFGADRETIIRDRLDPVFKKYGDYLDKAVFYKEGFFEPRSLFESIKTDNERSIILVLREMFDTIMEEFLMVCTSYLSKDQLPDILEKSKKIRATLEKL